MPSASASCPALAALDIAEDGSQGGTAGSGIAVAFLSTQRWDDVAFKDLSPCLLQAMSESFKFERLSVVQSATLPGLLQGEDVFAKAKTGGGKTLAFLIPALHCLLSTAATAAAAAADAPAGADVPEAVAPDAVGVLILTPTRELANQIVAEAKTLAGFADPPLRIMSVVGGTSAFGEELRMHGGGNGGPDHAGNGPLRVDVLVATPGRCVNHVEDTAGFSAALGRVSVLILDEADRMLDMGFQVALDTISACLPVKRQTMLFSATVAPGVQAAALRFLKPEYKMVDTVGEEEGATNPQVSQEALVVKGRDVMPALARVLAHVASCNAQHKTLVFLTTANMTRYAAGLFTGLELPNDDESQPPIVLEVLEMHSRLSQSVRTANAAAFRAGAGMVLFSSDLSARGMDYPGVTEVIQVGITERPSYIQRLGRTARAGREGAGLLIVADWEAPAILPDLFDLPIQPAGADSELTGGEANGIPGHAPHAKLPPHEATPEDTDSRARTSKPAKAYMSRFTVPSAVAPVPALDAAVAALPTDALSAKEVSMGFSAAVGFYGGKLKLMGLKKDAVTALLTDLWLELGCRELAAKGAGEAAALLRTQSAPNLVVA